VSGARDIVAKLHAGLSEAAKFVVQPGQDLMKAVRHACDASDIEAVYQRTGHAIQAAKHLKEQVTRVEGDLRDLLAAQMQDAGASRTSDGMVTVSLARRPQFASVDDEKQIPRHYFKDRAPELDKAELLRDMQAGVQVPGASIGKPNSMQLRITFKGGT